MLIDRSSNRSQPISHLRDTYSDDRAVGQVIGSTSESGAVRKGIDVEKTLSIDHGALRIRPLSKPGWAKQGIAYGPYSRKPGLALAVFLLNGHNTSQSGSILEHWTKRWFNWAAGIPGAERLRWRVLRRMLKWLGSRHRRRLIAKLRYWFNNDPAHFQPPELNENLAVGWFPSEVPADPLATGNSFIVHATGAENGELWTRVGYNLLSAFKGLHNIQTYYIIILRETGAAYYVAAAPRAQGFAAYPNMRPIAIDPFNYDATVYAAVYQSVLGQIGFMVDTRVYGFQVAQLPITAWYGTAQAADDLLGQGNLADDDHWTLYQGKFERTEKGTRAIAPNSLAVLYPAAPSGLIHLIVTTPAAVTPIRFLWRVQDQQHYCSALFSDECCQLQVWNGDCQTVAISKTLHLQPHSEHSIQLVDDGQTFRVYLDGKPVFDQSDQLWNERFIADQIAQATGFGIGAEANPELYFRHIEAHPRSIPIPSILDLGAPWTATGTQIAAADYFAGTGELAGRMTSLGGRIWRKEMGRGYFDLIGHNTVKVRASVETPNPDRTAYTIEWPYPDFADVQVEITPPGTARGQAEEGRGGLIFWQDEQNYMIVNNWLNNEYGGASVSSFFTLDGFEDLYDAVWVNVGNQIYWGVPHQFRIVFNGNQYTAFIDNRPILYRSITDIYPQASNLKIRRVGLVANWEWGNDTGSCFREFIAKI